MPNDDIVGTPLIPESLGIHASSNDQLKKALGFDGLDEQFEWISKRIQIVLAHADRLGKKAVFGTVIDDQMLFLIIDPKNPNDTPLTSYDIGLNPDHFDSTLGLVMFSDMAYNAAVKVVKSNNGIIDLVLSQLMMGLISFREARKHLPEDSIKH